MSNMIESRLSGSTSNFQPQVGGFNQKWCEVNVVTSNKLETRLKVSASSDGGPVFLLQARGVHT